MKTKDKDGFHIIAPEKEINQPRGSIYLMEIFD